VERSSKRSRWLLCRSNRSYGAAEFDLELAGEWGSKQPLPNRKMFLYGVLHPAIRIEVESFCSTVVRIAHIPRPSDQQLEV
jgi:hypothetical protein